VEPNTGLQCVQMNREQTVVFILPTSEQEQTLAHIETILSDLLWRRFWSGDVYAGVHLLLVSRISPVTSVVILSLFLHLSGGNLATVCYYAAECYFS
jgi:uncharacterized protein YjlB